MVNRDQEKEKVQIKKERLMKVYMLVMKGRNYIATQNITSLKMLRRLPLALTRVKAGNAS